MRQITFFVALVILATLVSLSACAHTLLASIP